MDHLTTLWRTSRGCCLVSAMIALLIILGSCLALGFGVARLTEAASDGGLDVMLVVDQSGSLWELEGIGTDPTIARGETAGRTWDMGETRSPAVTLGSGRDCPVALTGDPTLLPKTALIRAELGADGRTGPRGARPALAGRAAGRLAG